MAGTAPIIVAGAGPVGLTFALAVAQRGLPVRVFEKRPALSTASRASTFHPPTLEILDELGVFAAVRPLGHVIDRIGYFTVADGLVADFPLGLVAKDSRLPFRFHLEQARLTPALLEALRHLAPDAVAFDSEVVGVSQGPAGPVVTVRGPSGETPVPTSLVVGADGAGSAVRAAAGIDVDDAPYAHRVLRLMTAAPLERAVSRLAPVSYIFDGADSISLLRMRDVWRVIIRIPPDLADTEAMDAAYYAPILRRFLPAAPDPLPLASSGVYGVSKRMARRYRSGDVVLIGDAAHLTNTRGGMNMNAGIQDAITLADTLAAIAAGGSGALLDAWAQARLEVVTGALLPRTDRTVRGGGWLDQVRAAAADPEAARAFLVDACMIDIARVGAPAKGAR